MTLYLRKRYNNNVKDIERRRKRHTTRRSLRESKIVSFSLFGMRCQTFAALMYIGFLTLWL